MAKSSTTHVIEIESGIGEPAFIPLTLGKELEPISVGKKGMWRLESARVQDVHAFVYFDGTALFLQSADDGASTSVDGYPVGKAWTELTAPCQIEIGSARLRYRSLLAPASASGPPPPKQKTPPPPPIVTLPKSDMPLSFPKADRPFAPGELAHAPEPSEDTRVKPFDATSGARRPDEVAIPRFARTAGMPAVASEPPVAPTPSAPPVRRGTGPLPPPDPMSTGPMMPPGHQMMVTGPMMPPASVPPGSGGYAPHSGQVTGPHVPMPYGYGVPNGGMMGASPMTGPPPAPAQPAPQPGLLAKYKELSGPKKILVVLAPFCLLASGYLILFDEEPPAAPTQGVDAGAVVATRPSAAPTTSAPASNCPPGFVPWPTPINGTIPCVPATAVPTAATQPTPPQPTVAPQPTPTPQPTPAPTSPRPPVDAGAPPVATSAKTLERQAVDAVAMNDYARAAKIYEVLQQQNPTNRVYAEAARILRAKADAGAP